MRFLIIACCLWGSISDAQSPFTIRSSANDLSFVISYVSINGQNYCSPEWFVIEHGIWKCVRRDSSGLRVIRLGHPVLPANDFNSIVRGPVLGDKRLLIANHTILGAPSSVYGFDPQTLKSQLLGQFPQGTIAGGGILVDHDGDGWDEIAMGPNAATFPLRIVTLPKPGNTPFQIVRELDFRPIVVGQFDSDPQDELGFIDSNFRLRFRDASTLQEEPLQPPGMFFERSGAIASDWDADGIDEIAIQTCCPGPVALIDPNGPAAPIFVGLGWPQAPQPFAMVDWHAPGSQDIVAWSPNRMGVYDPISGEAFSEFSIPGFGVLDGWPLAQVDWEGDSDTDLLWQSGGSLWILRNPDALEIAQYGAERKRPMGYAELDGLTVLVAIESFSGPPSSRLRLRGRDIDTLKIRHDVPLGNVNLATDMLELADLHSMNGPEILHNDRRLLTVRGYDGAVLWQVGIGNSQRAFSSVVATDFTCRDAACRRVLVIDDRQTTQIPSRVRLLDGESGSELWSAPTLASRAQVLALTDLDTDGIPELLYAETNPLGGYVLIALDGLTQSVRWSADVPAIPLMVRRTDDSARRLALLTSYGGLLYLDPATGNTLRQIPITPDCQDCDLRYLRHNDNAGQWVLRYADGSPLLAITRDLRTKTWRDSSLNPDWYRTLPPNRIHISVAAATLHTLEVKFDELFADEFEGW